MAKKGSSKKWLQEHFSDKYVIQSQQDGYRGRAAYKLIELDDKYRLIRPGMRVIDLGAAPGSWSQVVARKVGKKGQIVASDILAMDPVENVDFVLGDFREQNILDEIVAKANNKPFDLVISDMAPNMSGMAAVDQPKSMYLAELALELSVSLLGKKGSFLVKVFHGEGFDDFVRQLRDNFNSVTIKKPDASRPRSREVYALARGRKL